MSTWLKDELQKIAEADDLHISPFREDGATYGAPTWIWSVPVGDALYVRAYNGKNSRWYQAACGSEPGISLPPGWRRKSPSSRLTGRSTTSSTTRTGQSIMAAR